MSVPTSSERSTLPTTSGNTTTPIQAPWPTLGSRGINPYQTSAADAASTWRAGEETPPPRVSSWPTIGTQPNTPTIRSNAPNIAPPNVDSPPAIQMPITYNLNNSPPLTVPNPTNSTPTFGPPNSGLETIRTNPIEFMTTFRSSVLSDIRTVHTNIINSFTAIENNYTKYFDAVSQEERIMKRK
ncbi:hypothetical protein EV361DRAFT_1008073 [Lentinula raphanica]|nr:hypothetical protein EV361DRAFT_1008073 [Lentinula raphanica]